MCPSRKSSYVPIGFGCIFAWNTLILYSYLNKEAKKNNSFQLCQTQTPKETIIAHSSEIWIIPIFSTCNLLRCNDSRLTPGKFSASFGWKCGLPFEGWTFLFSLGLTLSRHRLHGLLNGLGVAKELKLFLGFITISIAFSKKLQLSVVPLCPLLSFSP